MKGSSFTTFLMFLPLIAIPLLAIFGIPEFSPVNASPSSPRDTVLVKDARGVTKSTTRKSNPDFAPYENESAKPAPKGMQNDPFLFPKGNHSAPFPNPKRFGNYELAPNRKTEKPSTELNGIKSLDQLDEQIEKNSLHAKAGSNGQFAVPSKENELPATDWNSAIKKLKELGVTDYVLQPGTQPNACHFSCLYRSPNNPRITRRFEAEESSPLKAVSNVLAQMKPRLLNSDVLRTSHHSRTGVAE